MIEYFCCFCYNHYCACSHQGVFNFNPMGGKNTKGGVRMNRYRMGIFYRVFVICLLAILLAACCCSDQKSPAECQEYLEKQVQNLNSEYKAGASITLEKSASPEYFAAVGEVITYTYTLYNNGSKSFNASINVQDDKVTVSCPAVQNFKTNRTVTCTGTYTVTEQDFAQGQVVNNASAEATQTTTFSCLAEGGCDGDYWIEKDASYTARASTALTVLLDAQPALSLTKSASPVFHSGGQQVTYTYTLTNTGDVPLTAPFTIDDNRVPTDWSCEERAELLPGDTMLCQGSYFIDAGIRWTITNTATAYAFYRDQQVSSDTASAEVLYRQPYLRQPVSYCGDGVVNPELGEQCDPPDGMYCDEECKDL